MANNLDFSILKSAYITQAEFAKIAKVSRITVNNWANGYTSPHSFIHGRVTKLLQCIRLGVREGKLPVDGNLKGKHKLQALSKVIANYVVRVDKK